METRPPPAANFAATRLTETGVESVPQVMIQALALAVAKERGNRQYFSLVISCVSIANTVMSVGHDLDTSELFRVFEPIYHGAIPEGAAGNLVNVALFAFAAALVLGVAIGSTLSTVRMGADASPATAAVAAMRARVAVFSRRDGSGRAPEIAARVRLHTVASGSSPSLRCISATTCIASAIASVYSSCVPLAGGAIVVAIVFVIINKNSIILLLLQS